MNRKLLLAVVTVLIFTASAPAQNKVQNNVVTLFDGKTLNGWEGNLKVFRIEDGTIVGGTMEDALQRNEFLCTKAEYGDFTLRAKFKLIGDPDKANAGIQIRSRRIPNDSEVIGYQADLGQNYYGSLYDESRRKKVLAGPKPEEIEKFLKRGEWNDYEIRAEGNRIRLAINGYQTVDYTEAEPDITGSGQTGHVCLQIHAGPPSQAFYKEIKLEPLKNKK